MGACMRRSGCMHWFFCCKQKTAYEMRISDWSSDVCSSDLLDLQRRADPLVQALAAQQRKHCRGIGRANDGTDQQALHQAQIEQPRRRQAGQSGGDQYANGGQRQGRSEEHTSELQSLMRISYAVFCLKKKKQIYTPGRSTEY